MDDNSSLIKWSASGPVIVKMLQAGKEKLLKNKAILIMKKQLLLRTLLKRTKAHLLKHS